MFQSAGTDRSCIGDKGLKIGVYGGSFNPIHRGHLAIIEYVLEKLTLDKLLVIPVGIPSHRENDMASPEIRWEMCKKTVDGLPKVEVSKIEIESKEPSYTIHTMRKLEELYPGAEFYIVIGEDSAENLSTWKDYRELLKRYKIVVLRRKGYCNPLEKEGAIVLDMPYFDISSTEIREKVREGKGITKLVVPEVLKVIEEKRLYVKEQP